MAPPKAALSQAQGGMRSPPCFPTSHSTGPSPGPAYEPLQFRSQTRHTGSSSDRKLAGKPTHQLPWPPGYSLCVSESSCFSGSSRWPVLCFWHQGNELLKRKPEDETSSGNEKAQGQVKEQMTFLPEKYQEYSLNPTLFKSCPIQSRDPASPAQRGLDLYQDTASWRSSLWISWHRQTLNSQIIYHHWSVCTKLGELFFNKLLIPPKWD